MATKGPKPPVFPAAPKPEARATKPAASRARAVPPVTEKSAPEVVVEQLLAQAEPEPVPPALAATAQEVTNKDQAAAEPIQFVAATIVNEAEAVSQTTEESIVREVSTMETTIENNTVKAQAFFSDFNDRTKAAVEKSTKLVEEANDFAKGNVEALVESGRIAASGFQTLGQDAADYSRRSFETATSAMKSLASVKSPTEFFKLQSDFFRSSFDSYVAEASKNTEAMIKLASDAAQPLSSRLAVAVDKVKTAA